MNADDVTRTYDDDPGVASQTLGIQQSVTMATFPACIIPDQKIKNYEGCHSNHHCIRQKRYSEQAKSDKTGMMHIILVLTASLTKMSELAPRHLGSVSGNSWPGGKGGVTVLVVSLCRNRTGDVHKQ